MLNEPLEQPKHHLLSVFASTNTTFPTNATRPEHPQYDVAMPHQSQNISLHIYPSAMTMHTLSPHRAGDPDTWVSCAPHGIEGLSIRCTMNKYWCTTCWIPSTGALRTMDSTVIFYPPAGYNSPNIPSPVEIVKEAAMTLGKALTTMATNNSVYRSLGTHARLQQLCNLIHSATD